MKIHFIREKMEDLQPLLVTCTTDMAADKKLIGAGGGIKITDMFLHIVCMHFHG
jgi:hypothetical protein